MGCVVLILLVARLYGIYNCLCKPSLFLLGEDFIFCRIFCALKIPVNAVTFFVQCIKWNKGQSFPAKYGFRIGSAKVEFHLSIRLYQFGVNVIHKFPGTVLALNGNGLRSKNLFDGLSISQLKAYFFIANHLVCRCAQICPSPYKIIPFFCTQLGCQNGRTVLECKDRLVIRQAKRFYFHRISDFHLIAIIPCPVNDKILILYGIFCRLSVYLNSHDASRPVRNTQF